MNETIGSILIGVGVVFDLLGAHGLVRLPDVYNRLQAATKCVTLGTCLILVGVAVCGWGNTPLVIKSLLCTFFILLTSPVGAHALSRGAYRSGVKLFAGSVADEYADSPAMQQHHEAMQAAAGQDSTAEEQHDAETETA
jgi:multicomponent Na+:H+ antiporter subunit G